MKCFRWLCVLVAVFLFAVSSDAREITDMTGRKVVIPDTIKKVVSSSPPGTYLLYAIDPHALAGLSFSLRADENKYVIDAYRKLPVIGGMVGQGRTLNSEVLLKIKPDFVLIWAMSDSSIRKKYETQLTELNIPWVNIVRLENITHYPEALLFAGDLLNKRERGEKLHRYAVDALNSVKAAVAAIPASSRVAVYYAEGIDGLKTEREDSMHSELIPFAGGINVHKGSARDGMGMENISMEQVLMYDPEVILVKERIFYDRIFSDERWKNVKAVKNRRVHLIPHQPFNWFDRPPSFMRLLGAKWVVSVLYPRHYPVDMVKETKEFYKLFLGVDLNDREAREVLIQ